MSISNDLRGEIATAIWSQVASSSSEDLSKQGYIQNVGFCALLTAVTSHQGIGLNRAALYQTNGDPNNLYGRMALGSDNYDQARKRDWVAALNQPFSQLAKYSPDKMIGKKFTKLTITTWLSREDLVRAGSKGRIRRHFIDTNLFPSIYRNYDEIESTGAAGCVSLEYGGKLYVVVADNLSPYNYLSHSHLEMALGYLGFTLDHLRIAESLNGATKAGDQSRKLKAAIQHVFRNTVSTLGGSARDAAKALDEGNINPAKERLNLIIDESEVLEGKLEQLTRSI